MRRTLPALLLAAALALCACSSGEPTTAQTGPAEPTLSPPPTAIAVPGPQNRACYDLPFADALAPTTDAAPVDCADSHTSITYAVGVLDTVVEGHLLAVDSQQVTGRVAKICPEKFAGFIGGTREQARLSMLRPLWFTPTVEQSDAGAVWFRCDVVAVAGQDALAPLTGRLADVLAKAEGRDRWGMCGTAAPGTAEFDRVLCSETHSWRAISIVDFKPGDYPGEGRVRERGQAPCEDAGRAVAEDALNFQWGYEWPTMEQWRSGQTYGRCWAPD